MEIGGGAVGKPDTRAKDGSRNKIAHTMAETGLPGSPEARV